MPYWEPKYIFNSDIVSAIDLGLLTWAHYKPWIQSQDWICSFFNLMLGPDPAIGIRFGSISGDGFNWYRYTKASRWGQKSRHNPWTPLIVSVNLRTFHYQQQVPSISYQMHPVQPSQSGLQLGIDPWLFISNASPLSY